MLLSLVACSKNNNDVESENLNDQQETKSTENFSTEDKIDNGSPTFDTSWASNDFEALLPKLPFEGWKTTQSDIDTYKMEVSGLNTSPATNAPDSGEPDGADKEELKDYLESLLSYGFTVEEIGTDYMWEVKDSGGNVFEFMCGDGGCFITIKKNS